MLVLGLIFGVLGLISGGTYALVAGTTGASLRTNARYLRTQRLVSGCVLVGLGAFAALSAPPRRR